MTTCQVLRCQNPPTATHSMSEEPLMEAAVCSSHREMMEAGQRWSLTPQGVVHMGADVAPKLVTFKALDEAGSEPGFTLTMELDAGGTPRSQSVWVSEEVAKGLLFYLQWSVGGK